MKRKIEAMHAMFGKAPGKCGECGHLLKFRVSTRMLSKCEVYGDTRSEPRKPEEEEQIDGQMTIDDWLGGE